MTMGQQVIHIRAYDLAGNLIPGEYVLHTRRYRATTLYQSLVNNHGEFSNVYRWQITAGNKVLEWLINHQHIARQEDQVVHEGRSAFNPAGPVRNPYSDPELRRLWATGYARAAERFALNM